MLAFDCIVRDVHYRGVVAMDWGFWLRINHIRAVESKNNSGLAIMVEGALICFGRICDNKA
jgi:hypothetical protein